MVVSVNYKGTIAIFEKLIDQVQEDFNKGKLKAKDLQANLGCEQEDHLSEILQQATDSETGFLGLASFNNDSLSRKRKTGRQELDCRNPQAGISSVTERSPKKGRKESPVSPSGDPKLNLAQISESETPCRTLSESNGLNVTVDCDPNLNVAPSPLTMLLNDSSLRNFDPALLFPDSQDPLLKGTELGNSQDFQALDSFDDFSALDMENLGESDDIEKLFLDAISGNPDIENGTESGLFGTGLDYEGLQERHKQLQEELALLQLSSQSVNPQNLSAHGNTMTGARDKNTLSDPELETEKDSTENLDAAENKEERRSVFSNSIRKKRLESVIINKKF